MAIKSSRAESVFFTALEKSTPEERAAYLDEACGQDTKLRQRVEKMLNAQPNVGDFLQQPLRAAPAPLDLPNPREEEGTRIGRYNCYRRSAKAVSAWFTWPSSRSRFDVTWP
jgi:hypothetical protein